MKSTRLPFFRRSSTWMIICLLLVGCQPAMVATPAPEPYLDQPSMDPESYLTPVSPHEVKGVDVSIDPNDGWTYVESAYAGFGISIPSSWFAVESNDYSGFTIYPPTTEDISLPTPGITFAYLNRAYDKYNPVIQTGYVVEYIQYGDIEGSLYTDSEFAIPFQNAYVEIPKQNGMLLITATYGPDQNLLPVLLQILNTLVLY